MVVLENFRIALGALRANVLRSFLTTLGIIIGVAAVVAVVSIVQGLEHMITAQLEGVGARYVTIQPRQQPVAPGMVARRVTLTWEDGREIDERIPGVERITPQVMGNLQARHRRELHNTFVLGVDSDWPEVNNFAVDRGRFFSRVDLDKRKRVAVVGREVVEELRLGPEPLGTEISVGNLPLTVVGVMEEKGRALGFDYDDMVFVPFDTALSLFGRRAGEQVQLQLQVATGAEVARVKDDIRHLLRRRHDLAPDEGDDFQIFTQDELLDLYGSILQGVTGVVAGVVGIALLVGGIGIMNIMLVSVTERTREIGVRKAVGARKRDVLVQFLIEAVTLALAGGAVGIGVGYALGALAVGLIPGDLPPAHVPLWAIVLAVGFSAFVGIASGLYPAGKAARLDPIDALRYE